MPGLTRALARSATSATANPRPSRLVLTRGPFSASTARLTIKTATAPLFASLMSPIRSLSSFPVPHPRLARSLESSSFKQSPNSFPCRRSISMRPRKQLKRTRRNSSSSPRIYSVRSITLNWWRMRPDFSGASPTLSKRHRSADLRAGAFLERPGLCSPHFLPIGILLSGKPR